MTVSHRHEPHDVYWLYDAENRVLYVGCTRQLTTRLEQHAHDKEWWPRVARVEVEGYSDRAAALAGERAALIRERPVFNRHIPLPKPLLPPIIRRDEPLHAVQASAS